MIYENESGIFICDEEGRLLKYECSPENRLALSDCSQRFRVFGQDWENENRKDKSIRKLVIPSGVRQIGSCTSVYREKEDISFEDYVVRFEKPEEGVLAVCGEKGLLYGEGRAPHPAAQPVQNVRWGKRRPASRRAVEK